MFVVKALPQRLFAGFIALFVLSLALVSVMAGAAFAHVMHRSIAEVSREGENLVFRMETELEGFILLGKIGSDGSEDLAAQAPIVEELRALPPAELEARFREFFPNFAEGFDVRFGEARGVAEIVAVEIPAPGAPDEVRLSYLTLAMPIPSGAERVEIGWEARFGTLVIQQKGVDLPYGRFLQNGDRTEPFRLAGGDQPTGWEVFLSYVPVGFDHIVPKGLDHILFVLGLFFLTTRFGPLLWQISAFTLAHTITLALAALGIVSLPASIVEPLIAASIVFVAAENIFSGQFNPWRPLVVFGFGLLHGLGFASVLADFGLPENGFIPALVGFNVGVELGQIAIVVVMALLLWTWAAQKPWYRTRIATPVSLAIVFMGTMWFVERTFL
jgi:hypothetical protein